MKLKRLQENWDELGKKDPFWAILTDPTKRHKRWDHREFFKTGEEEIAGVMEYVDSLGIPYARNRALDFGCGVGRLTQALCSYFDRCYGVDIAPSMIKLARKHNRYGEKCRYHLNESDDLGLFDSDYFDFIYSNIVLQHIKPEYSRNYIKEFLRVLKPGGVLVFQIPSELTPSLQGQNAFGRALPESAFKAQIIVSEPFSTAEAGASISLPVKIKNISDVPWPARGSSDGKHQVRLGNHWLDVGGRLCVKDDGRTSLPKTLEPLEEIELFLTVTVPPTPGDYVLEFDMVQEWVTWFKDKGSRTASVPVQVQGMSNRIINLYRRFMSGRRLYESSRLTSKIEMYGLHRDLVLELVHDNGGRVVDVVEDGRAGLEWVSFCYCVTKE